MSIFIDSAVSQEVIDKIKKQMAEINARAAVWERPVSMGPVDRLAAARGGIYDTDTPRPVDEEEKTDPGMGPAGGHLRLEPNHLKNPPKCYLCARPTPTAMVRPSGERVQVCPQCVVTILKYDIDVDYNLTAQPED